MKLLNNKILITGGTSGIGLEMGIRLKELGNYVIVVGQDRSKLDNVNRIHGLDVYQCDLVKEEQVKGLIEAVEKQHPDINILINNAGVQYNYSFKEEVCPENISHEVEVNLNAVMKLCAMFIPVLMRNKEGAIVNISSGLALSPKKSAPVYCATKAGVHMFSKALRYQLEDSHIKVFEVLPPLVDTPMTANRGVSKISTEKLVDEFLVGLENNRFEMNIGKVKLLKLMHRISPTLAYRILKNN